MMEFRADHRDLFSFTSLREVARETLPLLEEGSVALSGGSTYAALFPLWASLGPDCRRTRFFPADERMVPFEDPASNWHNAYELLLLPVKRARDIAHHPSTSEEYNAILSSSFTGGLPIFDVIFLGMGEDGHIASLFPQGNYWNGETPGAIETVSPIPPVSRISLSPEVIVRAHKVVAIIAGEGKEWALEQVFQNNKDIPMVKILERRERVRLYVEETILKKCRQ